MLTCARENGVTLSASKFIFAKPEVNYYGFNLNRQGRTVDDQKTAAIQQFPVPTNRTDLRSLMGMINQCGEFIPNLAAATAPLRGLLKTSDDFLWTEDHTRAFNAAKDTFLASTTLSFFQVGQPLRLETDASVLKSLGFILWQQQGDGWQIIQCGSRYLSDTETRYAVIELELLAIVWAIQKCKLYLAGASFQVVTDHRSLVPILNNYSLDQVENPRLVRLLLKIRPFQFIASWRKGTAIAVAVALSRNPVALPVDEDQFGEDPSLSCRSLCICLSQTDNPRVDLRFAELRSAVQLDPDYQTLADFIQNGFPRTSRRLPPALAPFWNGREHLTVDQGIILNGSRIVIPASLRSSVVEDLHAAHQGIVRMKARARQIVYWPGMTKQLEELVRQCQECRTHQRSLSQEPLLNDRTPSLPFELTSADSFSCQGWDFLTYVDRLTGWPCAVRTGRSTSSHDVIIHLRRWFSDVGVPNVWYTDGGPQFASRQFAEFCNR